VDDECDESYECFVYSLSYNLSILYHQVVEQYMLKFSIILQTNPMLLM
jgi:hypothetical protein